MRINRALAAFAWSLLASSVLAAPPPTPAERRPAYPPTRAFNVTDDYSGTRVADPFRWLEDTDRPETWTWVEAQNKLTSMLLDEVRGRDAIRDRVAALWGSERISTPLRCGGRTFFTRNTGLQPQDVWMVQDSPAAEPRVLLDPNALSKDGTVGLSGLSVSNDGRLVAYSLTAAGSSWQDWHVRDVATSKDGSDWVKWAKFSGAAWATDGSGFYYSRYDAPAPGREMLAANRLHKVYFHRVGTPQSDDTLLYQRPDHPDWGLRAEVSDDGQYVVILLSPGPDRRNMIAYVDLTQPAKGGVDLIPQLDASFAFVGNDGPVFYFRTDDQAPRGRLVAIDVRSPQRAAWRAVLPEQAETLQGVELVQDTFVALYLQDGSSRVRLFKVDGTPAGELALPGIGSVSGFLGSRRDGETFYSFTGFATPPTAFQLDVRTGASTPFRRGELKFNPDDYVTTRVFCTSKDGTRVPLFLTQAKRLKRQATNPTVLSGYGGLGRSMTPSFSVANLAWMEMGGTVAVACLRGGGEYGEAWHQAGMRENKQKVFDDFIAAAEYLIGERYTSPSHLAIQGSANGGLLVGAVLNQRPDLFGAALPAGGVMDMLRFPSFPLGWTLTTEYGSPDDPKMFPVLRAYSPLHNIKPGVAYPPTLITTGGADDRVPAGHSYKYAATLQAAQGSTAPILIRIESKAGRSAGRPIAAIDEDTDRLAFLVKAFGMSVPVR